MTLLLIAANYFYGDMGSHYRARWKRRNRKRTSADWRGSREAHESRDDCRLRRRMDAVNLDARFGTAVNTSRHATHIDR